MERYKTNIHGLEDLILLGCQYSQNWPTFSMKPLLKFLFCRKGKADPKICMKLQGAVNSQKKSWKRRLIWGDSHFPTSKLIMTLVIKTVWHWHVDRYTGWWSRIKSLERCLYFYGQFIFYKGTKIIQWRKNSVFNK